MTPLLLLLYEFFLFSKVVGVCLCCCVKIKTVKTHIFSSVHLALSSSFFFVKKCCQLCCVCVCVFKNNNNVCNIAHHHQSFVQRLYNQFAFDRPKGGGEEEEEEDKEEEEDFVKVY